MTETAALYRVEPEPPIPTTVALELINLLGVEKAQALVIALTEVKNAPTGRGGVMLYIIDRRVAIVEARKKYK